MSDKVTAFTPKKSSGDPSGNSVLQSLTTFPSPPVLLHSTCHPFVSTHRGSLDNSMFRTSPSSPLMVSSTRKSLESSPVELYSSSSPSAPVSFPTFLKEAIASCFPDSEKADEGITSLQLTEENIAYLEVSDLVNLKLPAPSCRRFKDLMCPRVALPTADTSGHRPSDAPRLKFSTNLPTNLPKFNSDRHPSPSRFLEKLCLYLTASNYDPSLFSSALALCITGSASSWAIDTLPSLGFRDASRIFRDTFTSYHSTTTALKALFALKQATSTTTMSHVYSFRDLLVQSQTSPDAPMVYVIFVQSLKSDLQVALSSVIALSPPKSLEGLIRLALSMDADLLQRASLAPITKRGNSNKIKASFDASSSGSGSSLVCKYCKASGHLVQDCRKRERKHGPFPTNRFPQSQSSGGLSPASSISARPPVTCYKCGVIGHLSSSCPSRKFQQHQARTVHQVTVGDQPTVVQQVSTAPQPPQALTTSPSWTAPVEASMTSWPPENALYSSVPQAVQSSPLVQSVHQDYHSESLNPLVLTDDSPYDHLSLQSHTM